MTFTPEEREEWKHILELLESQDLESQKLGISLFYESILYHRLNRPEIFLTMDTYVTNDSMLNSFYPQSFRIFHIFHTDSMNPYYNIKIFIKRILQGHIQILRLI